MAFVTTKDGVEIFFKDWGPKEAQPIVFHHGWPLSSDDWDTQLLFFLAKGYRVVAHDRRGHGLYSITEPRHRALWDNYLALDPERASLVRGLASQHAFLSAPQLELTVNLRYATAIAWLLVEQHTPTLPPPGDVLAMARIWKEIFHPQGRLRDFTQAWHTCVSPMNHVVC